MTDLSHLWAATEPDDDLLEDYIVTRQALENRKRRRARLSKQSGLASVGCAACAAILCLLSILYRFFSSDWDLMAAEGRVDALLLPLAGLFLSASVALLIRWLRWKR